MSSSDATAHGPTGAAIKAYVEREFLAGDAVIDDDTALLELGIITSLGVMRLIAFIEGEFDVVVAEADLTAAHFESVASLAAYVDARRPRVG